VTYPATYGATYATGGAVPTFPGAGANSLGVKVELLSIVSAGVWTDITAYVRLRNPVQISGMGRADWTSTLQAATLTLTLDNRDGRFTPKLAAGAYYPNITRNTQIRVSVNAQSVTAVAYSGFRFWGEVSTWPPQWSVSGRDVYADITANGIWRRMSQLATSLGSAYTRYNSLTLTGSNAPRCYWPMEDGAGSGQLVSYASVAGTANAVQSFVTGQAGLSLAACTDFKGSDGIPQLNAAKITATVPAGGTATNNCTRFLISVPKAGDSASGTTNWNLAEVASAGTVAKFEIYLNATGTLLMQLRNSGGTVIASGTTTTNVKGVPVLASCELTPSGGNVAFAFRIISPGASGITESMTGTITTASVGAVTTVTFGRANVLMDTAVGHLSVTYGAVPLMVPAAYALGGRAGEYALDRFARVCAEMGIASETIGAADTNGSFTGGSGTGWSGFNGSFSVTSSPPAGALYPFAGVYVNNGVTAGAMEEGGASTFGFTVVAGTVITVSGWFRSTVTSIQLGFDYAASGGGFVAGPANATFTVPANTWAYLTTSQTVPATAIWARPRAGSPAADGSTTYAQGVTMSAAATSAAMGPQVDDTLTNVLQSVEDTDLGLLFESRTQFGLGYRTLTSMANQAAAATISYTAARLDPSLAPAFDDSLTRNNVTVTNQSTGYTQQAILTAGSMSILNPPNGIGNGYGYTRTVNAASDTQVAGIANWLLNVGSVDEIRFPVITLKMAHAGNAGLFAAIPGIRPGDYLQITSPPSFLTASTVKQLAVGYTETIRGTPREWTFAFNAVPESPYETGFSAGTVQTAQLPGSGAVTSTAPGAGGLGGIIQNGFITPAMLNQGITVKTLGGNRITISASAPANPDTNDIWIASATGLISQWNGSSWAAFKFDGSVTILPGTVVAANIATATLTASLIAAGQVYAGFVDSTTVQALQFIASGTQGEFLAYAGTPGAATLATVISGRAGTDPYGTAFAEGVEVKQGGLILDNQSSAPAAVTGASLFYSGPSGRPRYLAQSGADLVLERSGVSTVQFNQGNVVTAQPMSGILAYLAGEAQVSSEYEIEIMGLATAPSTIANVQTLDWRLYMDGANFGGGFTIGATVFSSTATNSQPFAFTVRFVVSVQSTGAGGAVHIHSDGSMSATANKTTSDTANLGGDADAVAFDTTANHNWQIRAFWNGGTGSGAAGQGLTTYRTKLVRRN